MTVGAELEARQEGRPDDDVEVAKVYGKPAPRSASSILRPWASGATLRAIPPGRTIVQTAASANLLKLASDVCMMHGPIRIKSKSSYRPRATARGRTRPRPIFSRLIVVLAGMRWSRPA
jgi:hypothetical protein